jgi:hypothetical protein
MTHSCAKSKLRLSTAKQNNNPGAGLDPVNNTRMREPNEVDVMALLHTVENTSAQGACESMGYSAPDTLTKAKNRR